MANRRTAPPRPPSLPPGSTEEGAARITSATIKMFDRADGTGADWRLMAESLFKAAFVMLDGLPDDVRQSVARRIHEGSYRRMLPGGGYGDDAASNSGPGASDSGPSNTAGLKSRAPKPPR